MCYKFSEMWIRQQMMLIFCLYIIFGYFVAGQTTSSYNNPPVGAFRVYPRTTFQCVGRPSGYYADVESGCQLYHMCDGLGRQFSYSCPNTTLFQQRMLICDHWYMVNCSRAESNYDANLLIGQRDKPFVPESEHELRTPRPDLLDRPYAADYAGESYRNQYKNDPPYQNTLSQGEDVRKQNDRKSPQINDGHYSVPGHWRISNSPHSFTTTVAPLSGNSPEPLFNGNFAQNIHQENARKMPRRRHDEIFADNINANDNSQDGIIDLGVSSSQDSRRSQSESHFENSLPTISSSNSKQYSQSTTPTSTTATSTTTTLPLILSSSIRPIITSSSRSTSHLVLSPNLEPPKHDIPKFAPTTESNFKGSFIPDLSISPTKSPVSFIKSSTPNNPQKFNIEIINPADAGISSTTKTSIPQRKLSSKSDIKRPIADLLPPYETLRLYDDSTTQGPPIYYEWKMPASAGSELQDLLDRFSDTKSQRQNITIPIPVNYLQPPKFGNETNRKPRLPVSELQPPLFERSFNNPTFNGTTLVSASSIKSHQTINKSPTPRSIPDSTHRKFNLIGRKKSSKAVDNNYLDLKKLLLIPDYTFPLEIDDGHRPNYQENDAVNSFQIKIPAGQKSSEKKTWYGENAECPECHPSFLKPGSCEPCIKFR